MKYSNVATERVESILYICKPFMDIKNIGEKG